MKYLTALCSISGTFPNWQQGGWFLLLVHSKLGRQGNEQIKNLQWLYPFHCHQKTLYLTFWNENFIHISNNHIHYSLNNYWNEFNPTLELKIIFLFFSIQFRNCWCIHIGNEIRFNFFYLISNICLKLKH